MAITTAAELDTALIRMETLRRVGCSRSLGDAEQYEFDALCNGVEAYKAGQRTAPTTVQAPTPEVRQPIAGAASQSDPDIGARVMRRELMRRGLTPRDAA